jgi:hypothetical protein
VYIQTQNAEVAIAVVRRTTWVADGVYVENCEIAERIMRTLGLQVHVIETVDQIEATIVPFSRSRDAKPPQTPVVIALERNAFSYKSLRYPFYTNGNVFRLLRWLRRTHTIEKTAGLFTPDFMLLWTLSLIAGNRYPSTHFRLERYAMNHIYNFGSFWRLGYIVLVCAQKATV